jgi:hypothetical protein
MMRLVSLTLVVLEAFQACAQPTIRTNIAKHPDNLILETDIAYGNSAFPDTEPNTFRLELGCVAFNCFCVNDTRIAWPGADPLPLNYNERTTASRAPLLRAHRLRVPARLPHRAATARGLVRCDRRSRSKATRPGIDSAHWPGRQSARQPRHHHASPRTPQHDNDQQQTSGRLGQTNRRCSGGASHSGSLPAGCRTHPDHRPQLLTPRATDR